MMAVKLKRVGTNSEWRT